jgi:hypothetical protein
LIRLEIANCPEAGAEGRRTAKCASERGVFGVSEERARRFRHSPTHCRARVRSRTRRSSIQVGKFGNRYTVTFRPAGWPRRAAAESGHARAARAPRRDQG